MKFEKKIYFLSLTFNQIWVSPLVDDHWFTHLKNLEGKKKQKKNLGHTSKVFKIHWKIVSD